MDITLASSLAAGAVGAAAGPLLTRLAHRRSLAQPVDVDQTAERHVVGAAIIHPDWVADGAELSGADFAAAELGRLWDDLQNAAAGWDADDLPDRLEVARDLAEGSADHDGASVQALVDGAAKVTKAAYVRAGEKVMACHEDRTTYAGRGTTVRDDDGTFARHLPAPGRTRRAVVTAVTAAAFALMPALSTGVADAGTLAWTLSVATGLVMVVMGMVVSLVDIDTLRIDLPLFTAGGAAAWAGAAGAAGASGDLGRVAVAAAATVAVVGLFEFLNFVHRRVRGHEGQGFGDTLLALVTVGVPVALSADALLAYWALMVAVVAVLATFAVRRLRGEPYATAKLNPFGPYLAGSWVLAWAGLAAGILPRV